MRDLDEDAANGRLYLPLEDLLATGIAETDPEKVLNHPALDATCANMAMRARGHLSNAREIMLRQPRRIARAPRPMAKVYQNILDRLVARGWAPPRRAIRVGRGRLLWIILSEGWSA